MRQSKSVHGIEERFVHVHERQDGSHHVFFSPPPEARPAGWPATFLLPRLGDRCGSLKDPGFRAAVIADAKLLNRQLDRRTAQKQAEEGDRRCDMPALVNIYRKTQRYKKLRDSSRRKNEYHIRYVLQWSESMGHLDLERLTAEDVQDFLSLFDDRESLQLQIRSTMNILFEEAVSARMMASNPLARVKWTAPETALQNLWRQEDVDKFVFVAERFNHLGLAALILAQWEVGQRPEDMRDARYKYKYIDGHFRVRQNKTKAKTKKVVNVSVTKRVVSAIQRAKIEGCDFVFPDTITGKPFTSSTLRERFVQVRRRALEPGEPHLLMQTLRHSCVDRLARAGMNTADIAQVTGHMIATVDHIMEHYLVRTDDRADEVQKRRNRAEGGDDSDFLPRPSEDEWLDDRERGRVTPPRKIPDSHSDETSLAAIANHLTDTLLLPRGSI